MNTDSWNPKQYQKFEKERNKPFFDLVNLIDVNTEMNVVDLGCGTGKLTKFLHESIKAAKTLGIDYSESMLKEAESIREPHLSFQKNDISTFNPSEKYDLIFSNAALQWVSDHPELFKRLSDFLNENGQFAFHMPANFDFPTHLLANEVAEDNLFRDDVKNGKPPAVLTIDEYAQLLYQLGFKNQLVKAQIYPHVLDSSDSLIEWVKGSLLTYYKGLLSEEKYAEFLNRYSKKIKQHFGENGSVFFPFKRIFIWAEK
jgi:trans-aconitate 2-methyltransferase